MNREQQRHLKQLLGRSVPKVYLDLIRRFPEKLAAALDETAGDAADRPLIRDAELVLAQNVEVREEDIWTEEGPWPRDHLLIGGEMGGDKFSLCVSQRPPTVWRLNHETGCFEPLASSLNAYLARVRRWLRGEQDALAPARPKRVVKEPSAPDAAALEAAGRFHDAGRAYQEAGEMHAALRCFDAAIEADAEDRWAWSSKRHLLDLTSLAQIEPKPHRQAYLCEPPLFASLAALHDALLHASQQVMRLDEDDVRHQIDHARYLDRVGRTSEALAMLRACTEEEPAALLVIAKLLEAGGDLAGALREIRTFLSDKDETDLDGYADEIRVLTKLGDAEACAASKQRYREHLEMKIARYPEDADWYREALAAIGDMEG